MADQEQINVSIHTTKAGWDHIIKLIQQDTDPTWTQFNVSFIKIIQDTLQRSSVSPVYGPQPQSRYEDDNPESREYHMSDDGRYHDEEYFGENYGSYSNYRRLSDEAADMGFPDAESYQNWLDD